MSTIQVTIRPGDIIQTTIVLAGRAGPAGAGVSFNFRLITDPATAAASDAMIVDATDAAVPIALPAPTANAQVLVVKDDASNHPVTVTGFEPLTVQHQSVLLLADGTQWRTVMAYTPGLTNVVAQINALKQQAISARVTQAGSATPISAAFGTQYEITGSTSQTINLPASSTLLATSTGSVIVKCGPTYSGTITVTPASGTIDGAASFTLVGGGQENIFEVGTSDADWQVG